MAKELNVSEPQTPKQVGSELQSMLGREDIWIHRFHAVIDFKYLRKRSKYDNLKKKISTNKYFYIKS